jgi:DNA-binding transcriptional LysR family regulator
MSRTYNQNDGANRGINNLKRMAYFAEVVETGSFTAAAQRLGITKAVVSQQVARLEQAFETTLLVRTTRSVRPTEEGRAFYERCARILLEAQEAFDGLEADDHAPTGTLRLTAPFDYGVAVVVPAIAEFHRRFPACTADVLISDQTLDPVEKDIELAIRVGWLNDSTLRARRIGSFQQILVGAPGLAARLTDRTQPDQIADLPFVANSVLRDPLGWIFSHDEGRQRSVRFSATLVIDATLGALEAVRAGAGASVLPDYAVQADLASGRLVRLLPDWRLESGGIYAVTPATRFRRARVSAFLDILIEWERRRVLATSEETAQIQGRDARLGRAG